MASAERDYGVAEHEFSSSHSRRSSGARVAYENRFHGRDMMRVFLEGQNPHLNPKCTTKVDGDLVYDPSALRRLARDLHHGRYPYYDSSKISSNHHDLVEFFEYATGMGPHQAMDSHFYDRFFHPHIHLPSKDFQDWSVHHMVGLVEEVYSFVDSKMNIGKLKLPRKDEHVEARSYAHVTAHPFHHRGEQPDLDIEF